jgi:hypothetical protein
VCSASLARRDLPASRTCSYQSTGTAATAAAHVVLMPGFRPDMQRGSGSAVDRPPIVGVRCQGPRSTSLQRQEVGPSRHVGGAAWVARLGRRDAALAPS